jgi:hypothetical protein
VEKFGKNLCYCLLNGFDTEIQKSVLKYRNPYFVFVGLGAIYGVPNRRSQASFMTPGRTGGWVDWWLRVWLVLGVMGAGGL